MTTLISAIQKSGPLTATYTDRQSVPRLEMRQLNAGAYSTPPSNAPLSTPNTPLKQCNEIPGSVRGATHQSLVDCMKCLGAYGFSSCYQTPGS